MQKIKKAKQRGSFFSIVTVLALALTLIISALMLLPAALLSKKDGALYRSQIGAYHTVYDPQRDGSVLRLHIVANSDSDEDQRIKLAIRNAVLDYERKNDASFLTATAIDAERELLVNGAGLLSVVREALKREGADYDAQLVIGNFDFPDREYDGKLYSAGNYRALRILLGEAEGKNWWCLLFPPLCIVRTDTAKITEEPSAETERESDGLQALHFESLLVRLWNTIVHGE